MHPKSTEEQRREIKARYLEPGMTALLTASTAQRHDDTVTVSLDGVAGELSYSVEQGVTIVDRPARMSCPRNCGVDMRDHNSSDLIDGRCDTDLRRTAYEIVVAGVAAGLPIPAAIDIPGHYHIFSVRLPKNDRAGVDAWAAHLGLDAPAPEKPLKSGVQNYRSLSWDFPPLPGWKAEVSAFCDKDGAL